MRASCDCFGAMPWARRRSRKAARTLATEEIDAVVLVIDKSDPVDLFEHKPLNDTDNIRLIGLEPAASLDEEIRCSLMETNLIDAWSYEALSYSWGEVQPGESIFARSIICNDRSLPVSAGAFHALRRLRLADRVRYLWIDAICIQQDSNAERSHQVQMMTSIYASASEVLIWVGEDDEEEDGKLAMKFLDHVARQLSDQAEGVSTRPKLNRLFKATSGIEKAQLTPQASDQIERQPSLERARFSRPRTDPDVDARTITLVVKFLRRRWYERRWVVQEVDQAAKARIFCGANEIDLALFRRGLVIIRQAYQNHELLNMTNKAILESAIELCKTREDKSATDRQQTTIFDKLFYCAHFQCSDPRDLIYSFLGIHNPFNIIPDYTPAVEAVFYDFARAAVENDWAATILFLAAVQAAKSEGRDVHNSLPSWVPDWRREVSDDVGKDRTTDDRRRRAVGRASTWDTQPRLKSMEAKAPDLRPLLTGVTTIRATISSDARSLLVTGRILGALSLSQGVPDLEGSNGAFLVKIGSPRQSDTKFEVFTMNLSQAEDAGLLLVKMELDGAEVYEIRGWCWVMHHGAPCEPITTICVI